VGTHDTLGVLEVAKDVWPLQVLRLPLGAGEVVYEVAESELLVRLHELGTKAGNQWTFPPTPFSLLRGAFLIDITAAVQTLWWIQAKSDCRLHSAAATVRGGG
jgi:hypothetical protein